MITVQAEVLFRVHRREDADRILTAISDLVLPEVDGSVGATVASSTVIWPSEPAPWQHPHMGGR